MRRLLRSLIVFAIRMMPVVVAWFAPRAGAQDLPRLSSGDEELQWIDHRYPEEEDEAGRRWALQRSIEYFADDPVTVFRARVRLALLDRQDGRLDLAGRELGLILQHRSGRIGRDLVAWAETIDGQVLADQGRDRDAAEVLDRIARDHRLKMARRTRAAAVLGDVIIARAPADALQVLREMAALPDGNSPEVEAGILHVLLWLRRDDEAARTAAALGDAGADNRTLVAILECARSWNLPGDDNRLDRLADVIAQVRPYADEGLQAEEALIRSQAAARRIHTRLVDALGRPPLSRCCHPAATDRFVRLSAFDRALAAAEQKGQPALCLDLSLRALAANPPGADFPLRLWQAAGFADWIERSGGAASDPAAETALLDLCDELPAGSTYHIEGKFLRAKRLVRLRDRAGEQSVLRDILAFSDLPARYREPACRELGASLEEQGEYAEAIRIYRQAEDEAGQFGSGVDCLLHAVLDNLALGQTGEALRLADRLEEASAGALEASEAPEEAREFATLAKTGRAAECWNAGQAWWPGWERLAGDEGVSVRTVAIPVVASVDALHRQAQQARERGNRAEYLATCLLAASAARWLPSYGVETAALEAGAAELFPEARNELRRLTIEVLAGPHPREIPGLRERQLYLATNDYSAQDPGGSLRVAEAFFADAQPGDGLTRAMHRIRALAALKAGRDYADSVAGLQGDLTAGAPDPQRAMSVGLLADLYARMGRTEDARSLLRQELSHAGVAHDLPGRDAIEGKLRQLDVAPAGTEPIAEWIRGAHLAWYDYAEPRSLADPRLQNLEEVLKEPARWFQPAEVIKLELLAAQDSRRAAEGRERSFREAVRQIIGLASDYGSMDALSKSIVDDSRFEPETRMEVLWSMLARLAEEGRAADYARWRALPLVKGLSPEFQRKLAVLDLEAAVDREAPDSILRAAERLGGQELDSYGALAMDDFMGWLLRLGAVSDAQTLAAKIGGWKFAAGAVPDRNALQLEFDRRIRSARANDPVHFALSLTLAAHFGPGPAVLPAAYADLRLNGPLPIRSPGDTLAAALNLVRRRQFDRADFTFWGTVLGALPRTPGTVAAVGAMLHAALGAAKDDETRSELMVLFFSSADTDDPQVRLALEREFAPYRDRARDPLCYLVVRLYEIHRDLRQGSPVALQAAFADLSDPRAALVRDRACLRTYILAGDRANLQRTVDGIDPGRLLSPGFIPCSLEAFRVLGMNTALAGAREEARRELYQALLESWMTRSEDAGELALDLAEALAEADALPENWVRDMSSGPGDPFFQERVRVVHDWLRADWAATAADAGALNQDYPTRYTYFWYRGLALHRLGRDREAEEPLRVFTQYAKDDFAYPEAMRLLAAMGNPATASN